MLARDQGRPAPEKQSYETPQLICFGSLSALTASGSPVALLEAQPNGQGNGNGQGIGHMRRARASY